MAVRDIVQAAAGQGGDKLYVEDVFSTYLYKGNGISQTINNGIDLDGEGGMVWVKNRTSSVSNHLYDTVRGVNNRLISDSTGAQYNGPSNYGVTSFNSNGFSLADHSSTNGSGEAFASWTWRKAPKFFDIVTWTGNGVDGRAIPHNLESAPGFLVVKRTDSADGWHCYHRSLNSGTGNALVKLESTASQGTPGIYWWGNGSTFIAPTSTHFTVSADDAINASGGTYVAYLFAHEAGGFGDDGEQNIISCGSFQWSSNTTVDLGWEPQYLLWKGIGSGNWRIFDNSRGWTGNDDVYYPADALFTNESYAEASQNTGVHITSTGFKVANGVDSNQHIYIAIRRPMKKPESGTEVFAIDNMTNASTAPPGLISGFPVDFAFEYQDVTSSSSANTRNATRLTGTLYMQFSNTNQQASNTDYRFDYMNGYYDYTGTISNFYAWMFKRAPGFMDVVAYTGTGSSPGTQAHNLGVVPEFVLTKKRNASQDWYPHFQNGSVTNWTQFFALTSAAGVAAGNLSPYISESTFSGNVFSSNNSGSTYVAYLFATLPGVSKVGSYTGTGADLNVDCGFSAGARFVLIKRTDSTGDWYVWDSVRGIVSGNDPYLLLNSTAGQNTSTDYIDPLASGFTVTSSAPAALNASGGSYIFLAIA